MLTVLSFIFALVVILCIPILVVFLIIKYIIDRITGRKKRAFMPNSHLNKIFMKVIVDYANYRYDPYNSHITSKDVTMIHSQGSDNTVECLYSVKEVYMNVRYDKRSKEIYLSVYPCEDKLDYKLEDITIPADDIL